MALSGTDASSNALFGSQQVITANKLSLSPILMGAPNSGGGVMDKMMAAQSMVIACAATGQEGKEGLLLRAVVIDVRLRVPRRNIKRALLLVNRLHRDILKASHD